MSSKTMRGAGYLILLLILFGLAGGATGEALGQNFKSFAFLKNYMTIGMTKPIILDLKLISLTFGASFNLNILSIAGMLLGFFIYKKM